MTTISAKVIQHSITSSGRAPPLVTMEVRCPRFILAEINTHRVFSRNARSSRAVPVATMIKEIEDDPVIPLHWGKNQPGMQATQECDAQVCIDRPDGADGEWWVCRERAWLEARDAALKISRAFSDSGYHKQVVNRLLEPFMHVDILITATQWDNFFLLRDHADAEPHIRILAKEMLRAIAESTPRKLSNTEVGWHLPYVTPDELEKYGLVTCRKLSVARCARISYVPFDGNASIEKEIDRYNALVGSEPRHSSPAEHQATPDFVGHGQAWEAPRLHGNLVGWRQFRRYLDVGLIAS